MGKITGMKRIGDNKLIFEVLVDQTEALHLKGHTDNIHIIANSVRGTPSRISLRGKNEATKYFLIPKSLRAGFQMHYHNSSVTCQKIDLSHKVMFVYTVSPFGLEKERVAMKRHT